MRQKRRIFRNVIRNYLGASLLENILGEKGIVRAVYGHGKEMIRAVYENKMDF